MIPVLRLHALLRDYRGPLRADFRREYGLDIDEVVEHRTLKPSVVLDLAENLSPGAALWRAIDPQRVWSESDYLTAIVIDRLGSVLNALGAKPKFDAFPRPGDKPTTDVIGKTKGFATIAEFDEWYAARRKTEQPD